MRKIKGRAGFSLAETLVALLILLLVSLIVVTGIPAARNAYEKVVLASNAQVLLSTTSAALRDEMGTAKNVRKETVDGIDYLYYYSADIGAMSRISCVDNEDRIGKVIMLQEYVQDSSLESLGIKVKDEEKGRPLVTSAAASGKVMYVSFDSFDVDADNNTVVFKALKVYTKSRDPHVLAELGAKAKDGEKDAGSTEDLTVRIYSAEPTATVVPGT